MTPTDLLSQLRELDARATEPPSIAPDIVLSPNTALSYFMLHHLTAIVQNGRK